MQVLGIEVTRIFVSSTCKERVVLTDGMQLEQPPGRNETVLVQRQPASGDHQRIRDIAWQLAKLTGDNVSQPGNARAWISDNRVAASLARQWCSGQQPTAG